VKWVVNGLRPKRSRDDEMMMMNDEGCAFLHHHGDEILFVFWN